MQRHEECLILEVADAKQQRKVIIVHPTDIEKVEFRFEARDHERHRLGRSAMVRVTYTDENIEDWDFRSYRSPFLEGGLAVSDPMVLFIGGGHFGRVLSIDCLRLVTLNSMIEQGNATLSPDSSDVTLTPLGEQALPYVGLARERAAALHHGIPIRGAGFATRFDAGIRALDEYSNRSGRMPEK